MAKRCKVCRHDYRGAGRIVVTADGRKVACPSCVERAFLVIPTDSFAPCSSCGKAASLCEVCSRGRNITDKARAMEDAALVLLGRVKPVQIRVKKDGHRFDGAPDARPRDEHFYDRGYVDGIEMTIATLRTGRF